MATLKEILTTVGTIFEQESFLSEPKELYEPIEYTLRLGGKRIRPSLVIAANQMFGGSDEEVHNAAIGIEVFHNFTLLHDDLMDKSPLRRGKETVYRKWNENTAILSGDTMFALAWRYFLKQPHPQLQEILNCFNETAIGVCEGQQYDMNFESCNDITINDYMEMIRLKTAVLLAGALKIGALYAQAPKEDVERLYNFGIHFGLAFQLQDDLLDAYGDVAVFGKQTGQDIRDNKKTYLPLRAMELASKTDQEELKKLFTNFDGDAEEKVRRVLAIYSHINIQEEVEKAIEKEMNMAISELNAIKIDEERKRPLRELLNTMQGRQS